MEEDLLEAHNVPAHANECEQYIPLSQSLLTAHLANLGGGEEVNNSLITCCFLGGTCTFFFFPVVSITSILASSSFI